MAAALAVIMSSISLAYTTEHVVIVLIDGVRYTESLGDPTGQYCSRMTALGNLGLCRIRAFNDSVTVTASRHTIDMDGAILSPAGYYLSGKSDTNSAVTHRYGNMPGTISAYRSKKQSMSPPITVPLHGSHRFIRGMDRHSGQILCSLRFPMTTIRLISIRRSLRYKDSIL